MSSFHLEIRGSASITISHYHQTWDDLPEFRTASDTFFDGFSSNAIGSVAGLQASTSRRRLIESSYNPSLPVISLEPSFHYASPSRPALSSPSVRRENSFIRVDRGGYYEDVSPYLAHLPPSLESIAMARRIRPLPRRAYREPARPIPSYRVESSLSIRQAHSSFELSHESSIEMRFPSLANNHTPPSAHRCSCFSCHNIWARTHNLNLVPPIRGTIIPAQEETTAYIVEVEEEQEHHPASPKSPKTVTHEDPKENVSDSDSVNQVDVVKEKGKLKRTRKEGGEDEGASPSPRLSKRVRKTKTKVEEPRSHASATSPTRSEKSSASYC